MQAVVSILCDIVILIKKIVNLLNNVNQEYRMEVAAVCRSSLINVEVH